MTEFTDSFDTEFDFTGDDLDRDGKGGGVAPGAYTFQCTNVILHTEKSGDMQLDLEVLNGTVPTEVGKTHHEYLKYPDGQYGLEADAARRSVLRQVLYSLQLTTPEQIKANPRIRVNWALAVGKVCKGKLIDDPYEKNGETIHKSVLFKKGHWGLWAPNDPKAAGIPGLATDGQQPGNSPAPPQAPPPPADNDPFGGLPV